MIEPVESELYIRSLQCDVRAPLNIGRTPGGVVDWYAVNGDVHEIESERILRRQLAGNRSDLDTVQVTEQCQLVVDHLDGHVCAIALNEARVYDIVRVDISAAFVLDLLVTQFGL